MLQNLLDKAIYLVCMTKCVWVTAIVLVVAWGFMRVIWCELHRATKRDYPMLDKLAEATLLMSFGIFGLYLLFWLNVLLYPMSPDSTVPWVCVGVICAILCFIWYVIAVVIRPKKAAVRMPVIVLLFMSLVGSSTLIPHIYYF